MPRRISKRSAPPPPTDESGLPPNATPIVKMRAIGAELPGSRQLPVTPDDLRYAFTSTGALAPPYDPAFLLWLFEHSSALRQCVDAYVNNIEAFGHRLEPVIELDADDAEEQVANAIFIGRMNAGAGKNAPWPTPEEVAAEKERIRREMRAERLRLDLFLEYASLEQSFVTLRRQRRQDLEVLGYAYWEVSRDRAEDIVELIHVPAHTIRLLPLEEDPISVEVKIKISPVAFGGVRTRKRFRRYVQVIANRTVFFKEFGDPRVISRKTGAAVPVADGVARFAEGDGPASELAHFRLHAPSPYGVCRWIGTMLTVMGLREEEEVNKDYFENKTVPPLLVMASGGRFRDGSVAALENTIRTKVKGKDNFWNILLLEAEPSGTPGDGGGSRVRIQAQPLTDAMLKEAIHGKYDERCIDKVGFAFRLPRLLRGDIQDVNRATSMAALAFAESQVFQPERQEFDDWMNRRLLAEMGIRYWKFVSNGPIPRDSQAMAELISSMTEAGVLTPEEARQFAVDVFNVQLKRIDAAWAKQPLALTLKEASMPAAPPAATPAAPAEAPPAEKRGQTLADEARRLISLRDALREEEKRAAVEAFKERSTR